MEKPSAWERLIKAFQDASKSKLTDSMIRKLASLIVEEHSVELNAILRVESRVNTLAGSPFNAGVTWFELAAQPQRSRAERTEYLKFAPQKFIDAQAQQSGFDQAVAQLHVALCFVLLKQKQDANEWLIKAYRTADADVNAALQDAKHKSNNLLAIAFGAGRASRKFIALMERNNSLISAIEHLLPEFEERAYWEVMDDK